MALRRPHRGKAPTAPKAKAIPIDGGRYIYCIAAIGERVSLGETGIGGRPVYTIPHNDIGAVVHDCPAIPYRANDEEVVKGLLVGHHKVVDIVWERWGSVLPLSFGTIITGKSGDEAEQKLVQWLEAEYQALKRALGRLEGKAEYGVQIFWEPKVIAQKLAQTNPEIRQLGEEIKSKPGGLAYLHGQRLASLIKRAMETEADQYFRDCHARISKRADDIRVEKTKKEVSDLQMLMNLSCLVPKDREAELGEELDQINRMEGLSVRFTGPWPPYSFTTSA